MHHDNKHGKKDLKIERKNRTKFIEGKTQVKPQIVSKSSPQISFADGMIGSCSTN